MKEMDVAKLKRIKELLESEEQFPLKYTFKFIVPVKKLSEIISHFPDEKNLTTRPSSKGSYISVTVIREVHSPDEVIKVYQNISVIEGVISL
jgi:putative lipoic acid-binding regulatory protein